MVWWKEVLHLHQKKCSFTSAGFNIYVFVIETIMLWCLTGKKILKALNLRMQSTNWKLISHELWMNRYLKALIWWLFFFFFLWDLVLSVYTVAKEMQVILWTKFSMAQTTLSNESLFLQNLKQESTTQSFIRSTNRFKNLSLCGVFNLILLKYNE